MAPRRGLGRRRSERGAIFVEFALVLPLLMSLVLGIYTGGQAYTNKIGVVEAVREGARYGASLEMGDDASALATWKGLVKSRVVDASGGDILVANVCVEWVLPGAGTLCGLADPAGASNGPEATVHLVKVSATKPAKMEFFFFSKNTTLRGELVARFERDTG